MGFCSNLKITFCVGAAFSDKIQSYEGKRLLGISDHRVVFDARRNSNRIGQRGKRPHHAFRHASRGRDFQIVFTSQRFHRTPE